MSSTISRAICALFFVFGGQAVAEIPLVTTIAIPTPKVVMPTLPQYGVQSFQHVKANPSVPQDVLEAVNTTPQADVSAFGTACSVTTRVNPAADAMITVQIEAPCLPHSEAQIFDGVLSHFANLSLTGTAQVSIPAMAEIVDLAISIDDKLLLKTIKVPEFTDFVRVAMTGSDDVRLAATLHGDDMDVYQTDGLQVFSVDMRETTKTNLYRMVLRRHITDQNCDQPQDVILHRFMPGKTTRKQALRLNGSNCARSGTILELKNIVPDLKVAVN